MVEAEIQIRPDRLESIRHQALNRLDAYLQTPEQRPLWEHQVGVMQSLRDFLSQGETAGYISLPTGSGKTVIIAELAQALGLRTIVLSPTKIILEQTLTTTQRFAPEANITSYYSGKKNLAGQILNTTYQSALSLLEKRAIKPEEVELLICDEVHTALGEQRHRLFSQFPNALMIGLTATPFFTPLEGFIRRGLVKETDRLRKLFTECIHEMSLEEAIEKGILVNLDVHLIRSGSTVEDIEITSTGEYNRDDLERYLNTQARNYLTIAMIVGPNNLPDSIRIPKGQLEEIEKIHQKIKGKTTAIFGLSIDHIEKLAYDLRQFGISAQAVHSLLSDAKRKEILDNHATSKTQVILGVDAIRLGWDSPPTEVGIYLAPTRSGIVAVQELGRILRISPQTGKDRAIAIQLVDYFKRPSQAPILIPNILNPFYVLRGTQTGLEATTPGGAGIEKQPPKITFSGMDVEAIFEEVKTRQLLQMRLKGASIKEVSAEFDTIIARAVDENPQIGTLALLEEVAKNLSHSIPSAKQSEVLQAIASIDSNIAKMGRNVLLFLNSKTIINALSAYLTNDDEYNTELTNHVISELLSKAEALKSTRAVPRQIYQLAKIAAQSFIAEDEYMPRLWIERGQHHIIRERVDQVLKEKPYGLTKDEIDQLAEKLHIRTAISEKNLKSYIKARSEMESKKESTLDLEDLINKKGTGELKEEMGKLLDTLTERERIVLRLRFGLDTGIERTLEDVGEVFGVTGGRIGQIEAKALRKLRYHSRSKK